MSDSTHLCRTTEWDVTVVVDIESGEWVARAAAPAQASHWAGSLPYLISELNHNHLIDAAHPCLVKFTTHDVLRAAGQAALERCAGPLTVIVWCPNGDVSDVDALGALIRLRSRTDCALGLESVPGVALGPIANAISPEWVRITARCAVSDDFADALSAGAGARLVVEWIDSDAERQKVFGKRIKYGQGRQWPRLGGWLSDLHLSFDCEHWAGMAEPTPEAVQ